MSCNVTHYSLQDVMDDMLDLLDLRQEIMERVENVLEKAQNYQRKFDCYAHLWQDDRAEFLRHFLLYGRILAAEDMEAYGADTVPESPPSIANFKEQVNSYFKCHFLPSYGMNPSNYLSCLNFTDRLL